MSTLLEQAIIEAEELKRIATRNAEQALLEKYSKELKDEVESLIEQDLGLGGEEFDLGGEAAPTTPTVDFEGAKDDDDQIPTQLEYAAFDGQVIGKTKYPKENEVVEINLDSLSEYEINPEAGPTTRNMTESIEIDDALLAEMLDEEKLVGVGDDDKDKKEGLCEECGEKMHEGACAESKERGFGFEESLELDEEALEEMIKLDFRSVKTGNPFGSITEKDEFNLILNGLKEQAEELNAKNESLSKEKEKLISENAKYKKNFDSATKKAEELKDGYASLLEKFKELRSAFEESQTMNAKLVYTNRVLSDDKLNVRQKNKIVESIQDATSVENAKIMYETLVNAVESTSKKSPESLSEAVTRRASPLLIKAANKEDKPSNDFASRMKRLAGIDI